MTVIDVYTVCVLIYQPVCGVVSLITTGYPDPSFLPMLKKTANGGLTLLDRAIKYLAAEQYEPAEVAYLHPLKPHRHEVKLNHLALLSLRTPLSDSQPALKGGAPGVVGGDEVQGRVL